MNTPQTHTKPSFLTLGWELTATGDPRYWLQPSARAGEQEATELVTLPAPAMGSHTVIIAQSGSGKSALLGRIIEELLLHTRARCLVFDPNADFWKVHEVEDSALWTDAHYDVLKRCGKLPDERDRATFAVPWSQVGIRIMTSRPILEHQGIYQPIKIWWPSLTPDVFAEDLNTQQRSELYHCHAFVRTISRLAQIHAATVGSMESADMIDIAEKLYYTRRSCETMSVSSITEAIRSAIDTEFNVEQMLQKASAEALEFLLPMSPSLRGDTLDDFWRGLIDDLITHAAVALPYISEEVGRFYFAKAREYQAARILEDQRSSLRSPEARLEILDLPSLPDMSVRFLVISAMLANEWERARRAWAEALERPAGDDTRVPTFIILDEAHNLAPAEPQGRREEALRDQFRTIAAEGRKYGLFLILVSQRPDKLDPLILSECENKALMRLDSEAVLDLTRRLLGLEHVPTRLLERCLDFGISRALLIGRWAPEGPRVLYSAARRTTEGGRNLRSEYWAVPPVHC